MRWGFGPEAARHPAVSVRSVVVWSNQRDFVLLSVQEAVSERGVFCFSSLFTQFSLRIRTALSSFIHHSFNTVSLISRSHSTHFYSSFQTPVESTGTN